MLALCCLIAGIADARSRVMIMDATAFSQRGQTASGTMAHRGVAAADPAVLPLGSVVRVTGAGRHSGIYIVTDEGRKITGQEIDLFIPSAAEAKQFGKKRVRVTVLDRGEGKADARSKDGSRPSTSVPPQAGATPSGSKRTVTR